MQILLGTVTENDYAIIAHLKNKKDSEGLFEGEYYEDSLRRLRRIPNYNPDFEMIARTDEDEIVGHILLMEEMIINGEDLQRPLMIKSLSVKEDYREYGIGKALVEAVESRAKEAGYNEIIVEGEPEYFRSLGFVPLSNYSVEVPDDEDIDQFSIFLLWDSLDACPQGKLVLENI
ncbi:GNAT family N-acetyltransferase [Staphylococcus carnosus]|uniref:Acetyltransferase (GNAT) family protein n=2 Tax=Staphylococcus carnosus TaxID=1281 RepID=B9DLF4_STACT|nr:N-acetyltransferase [Staphylococcus carnosus]KKB24553.1 GNAT family acetyltransferase [Staphylococcus carnosus]KOR12241.1 GNAT family acetyltransferase [Staphylococcus carnosus]POA04870.1 N-acetyltransferase [Staphylococcus carnosus]QPT03227.1 N-acetyltransferase [Staphylococcus carnosus]QQS86175.1 N-acetyltransferase [Staphylococcus carnosus]